MVQATDLKIGNRFIRETPSTRGQEFDHDFVLTEEWMGMLFGENTSFALNDLHPIPLTPEILEKAGFIKMANYSERDFFNSYYNSDVYISYCKRTTHDSNSGDFTFLYAKRNVKIEYLHQLQNLYYALTGEELEINLT